MSLMDRLNEKVGPLPVIGWIGIGGIGIALLAARSRSQAPAGGAGTVTLAPGDTTDGVTATPDQTIAGILGALKDAGATGATITLPGGGSLDIPGFSSPPGGGDLPPNPAPGPAPDTQPPPPFGGGGASLGGGLPNITQTGGPPTPGPVSGGVSFGGGTGGAVLPPGGPALAPPAGFTLGPDPHDALINPH